MIEIQKSKDEIKAIASEIADLLKTKSISIWQAKEVLAYAKGEIENTILK